MTGAKRKRNAAWPLLVGTFLLRLNGGASSLFVGRFLAGLNPHHGHIITSLDVGLLSTVYFAVELSLSSFMGALSDHWGRKIFLALGPFLGLVQVTLFFFCPTENPLPYLLGVQVFAGLSAAMQVPAVLGYLADYSAQNPELRGRVMSFYELVTSLGLGCGVVIAGFVWEYAGRASFLWLAVIYSLAGFFMLSVTHVNQLIEHGNLKTLLTRYWAVVRQPRLFLFIPAWISIFAVLGIWLSTQLTYLLSSKHHMTGQILMGSLNGPGGATKLSIALGIIILFFGLCLIFWAYFLNRFPRIFLMLCAIGGVFLGCLALERLNHLSVREHFVQEWWFLLLLVGIFAMSAFAPAALSYLADISEGSSKDRGLLMGLYSVFLGVGQIIGNSLGGFFAQTWGFDGLVDLTIMLAVVAAAALLALHRFERREISVV